MRILLRDGEGNCLVLDISSLSTVGSLKNILISKIGVPESRIDISYLGTKLNDYVTLKEYHISNGSTLVVSIAPATREDIIEEIVSSPEVQRVLREKPFLMSKMELEDFVTESIAITQHPEVAAEVGRIYDLFLNQMEVNADVFMELVQNYTEFEDSGLEDAIMGKQTEEFPTVIEERGSGPNESPLPVTFDQDWFDSDLLWECNSENQIFRPRRGCGFGERKRNDGDQSGADMFGYECF